MHHESQLFGGLNGLFVGIVGSLNLLRPDAEEAGRRALALIFGRDPSGGTRGVGDPDFVDYAVGEGIVYAAGADVSGAIRRRLRPLAGHERGRRGAVEINIPLCPTEFLSFAW